MPDYTLETGIGGRVCGVDEAGRGPWAGPVVAGAVVLDLDAAPGALVAALDDSKKLKPARRAELFAQMRAASGVDVGLGIASVAEIDALNILQATFLAMKRAVADLPARPDFVLVDGNKVPPDLGVEARAVVKGDQVSLSIAAASIAAKVTRDDMMADLDRAHPGYGWASNQGYGTKAHVAGLERLGVSEHHRRSFAPVRKILSPD